MVSVRHARVVTIVHSRVLTIGHSRVMSIGHSWVMTIVHSWVMTIGHSWVMSVWHTSLHHLKRPVSIHYTRRSWWTPVHYRYNRNDGRTLLFLVLLAFLLGVLCVYGSVLLHQVGLVRELSWLVRGNGAQGPCRWHVDRLLHGEGDCHGRVFVFLGRHVHGMGRHGH
uniref:Uncharacterized protein n=1 Tax=Cacopsylla melanoneura TaxID=428564 RepID=A0A8D8RJ05_9HEMI